MDFEIWTIHYDFKKVKVLHVLIIIYILYVLKNCLYAMLYPMIIVHSHTRNIFFIPLFSFYQFVLYMYCMYKMFIIFLLAENNFKDNLNQNQNQNQNNFISETYNVNNIKINLLLMGANSWKPI